MEFKDEIWDQIIAGQTGNPATELEMIENVKNEIQEGRVVYLTIDGIPIYKLDFALDTQRFIKIQL